MNIKKVISFVMALVMIFSVCSVGASAKNNISKPKNDAPFIFVHGLNGWGGAEGIDGVIPYWGATTGDLMRYLQYEGYECYSASVGPVNSAWDRACELYAQIIGARVDYGEAHSKEFNHERYGRTYYDALVPNWGELDESGKIKQIHLIGHSFGGTTVRLLIQLLTEGSAEEMAVTPSDSISGLFTGGKFEWVKSATAICTPHNSATVYYPLDALGLIDVIALASYLYIGVLGRSPLNGELVDFHMEQYGLSEIPGGKGSIGLFKAIKNVLANKKDSSSYDLTPEGTLEINESIDISEDIYYFSYPFSTTKSVDALGIEVPKIKTNPVIFLTAMIMGVMKFKDPDTGFVYDESWLANDALVNTESAKYPFDEPYTDYDENNVVKGVWNVMPVSDGDHGTAIGLFADKEQTQAFYLEMCEMLNALPD
ncbi:MAG: hypothetical protein J6R20_06990 [Clostridia bacterium]|nr:hypothetical protein [Clostridia bacterium]